MSRKHSPFHLTVKTIVNLAVLAIIPGSAAASESAVRNVPAHPNDNPSFAISESQTVLWEAFVNPPIERPNFILEAGEESVTVAVLSEGFQTGSVFLEEGNYQIHPNLDPGRYAIIYDRQAVLDTDSPLEFGRVNAGESRQMEATITNGGDSNDLAVTLTSASSSDAARFVVLEQPSQILGIGQSEKFEVRYIAGADEETHAGTITVKGTSEDGDEVEASITVTGETHVPLPDIACRNVTPLGDADPEKPGGEELDFSFTNSGDAPLVRTMAVELESDENREGETPIFAWPGGSPPSWQPVPANGRRDLPILFRPTEERTYRGHLVIHSNDPDEAPKICDFEAVGHHPRPIARFQPSSVSFGEVQLGFSFTRALRVFNDGDAALVLDVGGPAEEDPWPELPLGRATVAPDGVVDLEAVFHPLLPGPRQIELEISTNQEPPLPEDVIVQLSGTGVFPTPIDSVLLLDRSGSMAGPTGFGGTKIEALSDAARLYTDILRSEIPDSGTGDRLGLVRYNETWDTYLDLGLVDDAGAAGHRAVARERLRDIDGQLAPRGGTSIGGALAHGASLLESGDDTRSRVIVALTDGRETAIPFIGQVLPGILTADPDLAVYTVGLGVDASLNSDVLQNLAQASGGRFYALPSLAEDNLRRAYFDIFRRARRLQAPADDFEVVPVGDDEMEIVELVRILTSDHSADFLVLKPDLLAGSNRDSPPFDFEVGLIDPSGRVLTPETAVADASVSVLDRPDYTGYRVIFPDASESSDYAGLWRVFVRPSIVLPSTVPLPFTVLAAVGSDYRLETAALSSGPLPGAEVLLRAALTDRETPAVDGDVVVDVLTPRGRRFVVALTDDAAGGDDVAGDAVWSGRFLETGEIGSYRFRFEAIGRNERGELGRRLETRYVYLGPPTGGADDPTVRRLFGSVHAGLAYPVRGFDPGGREAEDGTYLQLDLTYRLTDTLSLRGMLGGFELPGSDEPRWGHLSLNLHAATPFGERSVRPYLQLGPGLYRADGGPTEPGFNLGTGFEVAVDPPFLFSVGADLHHIAGTPQRNAVMVHVGFVF